MGLLDRVSQLMTSDINHLLDQGDDPERTIGRLIGEMEESIVDLRRETVTAVARQSRIRKQLFAAEEAASRIECEATMALARGEEVRARQVIGREIGILKARDTLEIELADANRVSARLVAHLIRMEDRAQVARRKRDDLQRRRRAEDTGGPTRSDPTSGPGAFEGYARAVTALEVEAEATLERPGSDPASPGRAECCLEEAEREMEGGGQC